MIRSFSLICLSLLQAAASGDVPVGNLRAKSAATAVNHADTAPIAVIGAGYSGLSAALELKQLGHDVVIYEQSDHVGGRGYAWSAEGFTFDAGPSWYWMPEIFDQIFEKHGRKSTDYYNITRLDPAYSVYFAEGTRTAIPGNFDEFLAWAESVEPQAKQCIHDYFENAKIMYDKGIGSWIWKPMVALTEFMDFELIKSALTKNMFGSLEADITKCVKSPELQQVLKWPVIFLGASPKEAPAMYSLMTYAGHAKGTWYPDGGMSAPAKGLAQLARDKGVQVKLNSKVEKLTIEDHLVKEVCVGGSCEKVSGVVGAGDYHALETRLLPPEYRRYKEDFWDNQVLSPSVLLYYLGVNKVLPLGHHTFFFDDKLDASLKATIVDRVMPKDPVFYITDTSKIDPSTAPKDSSALFILVPVSYTLNGTDTQAVRDSVYESVIQRMEIEFGPFRDSIVYKKDYGSTDFEKEFGAFRGNAFGHANLLEQSLILKPSMDSLLGNMVFAGHLTNPGPGVPPALASGATAAHLLESKLHAGISWMTILNIIAAALLIGRLSVSTKMMRSKWANMRLFYHHGRTFFAGASLMKLQEFLDTAALYGMMRVADDCVDDVDDHAERKRRLAEYEGKFWKAWESRETDCYHEHPTLPHVIEVSNRLNFSREMFECFFSRMRADADDNICRNMEDVMWYIEGSAAVVGEFMLPILMPDSTRAEREAAKHHAKDLGRAFQLTNFCRDIDEDIDIQRQYVPVDLCKKHGVDLYLRTQNQEGFRDLVEEIFAECDRLYVSGDKGIKLLPERVRPVVLVASRLYQQIQNEVRKKDYNVFNERVRVPTKQKIKTAMEEISPGLTLKMIAAELVLLFVFFLDEVTIPFVTLLASYQLCDYVSWPGMTYYGFHCVFTLPQVVILYFYAKSHAESTEFFKMAFKWMTVLCVVATLYTTPWDNYLVMSGVWGYGSPTNTLGVIGYVPIEEYAFFTIETFIVGLIWVAHSRCGIVPHFRSVTHHRNAGLIGFFLLMIFGYLLLYTERGTYFGLITVWAVPVLALQWAFGADALMAQKDYWQKPLLYSWFYLCVIDRFAIRNGCWSIAAAKSAPMLDWLPIEEAYFFACTATMLTWGLQLAMNVSMLDCGRDIAFQRVIFWCRKVSNQKFNFLVTGPFTLALRHTIHAILLSMCALVFARDLSMKTQVMVLVCTTAIFGLPHGAVDMIVADWMQIKQVSCLQLYFATMACVVLGWFAAPRVMLVLFVGKSILHFGEGFKAGSTAIKKVDILAWGGMILIPIKVHLREVTTIFTHLVGGSDLTQVMSLLDCLAYLHAAAVVVSLLYHIRKVHMFEHLLVVFEIGTLCAVFCLLPPLVAFVIYFNIFHAARHLMRLGDIGGLTKAFSGKALKSHTFITFAITVSTVAVCVAFFAVDSYRQAQVEGPLEGGAIGPALRAVFIGLSALTTPHMFLIKSPLFKGEKKELIR